MCEIVLRREFELSFLIPRAIASGEFYNLFLTLNCCLYIASSSLLNTLSYESWVFLILLSMSASIFSRSLMLYSFSLLMSSALEHLSAMFPLAASILA